jgi:valyl-tRNA synthetase
MDAAADVTLSDVDRWIVSRLQRTEQEVVVGFKEYRFDMVARAIYEFVWDEFCDWYVEAAKVQLRADSASAQRGSRKTLLTVLEAVLRLAHPIIPFVTEALWQKVAPLARKSGDSVMLAPYPAPESEKIDEAAEARVTLMKEMVNASRQLRSQMDIDPGNRIPLVIAGDKATIEMLAPYLQTLARLSEVVAVEELPQADAPIAMAGDFRLMAKVEIDVAAEKERLRKQIDRIEADVERSESKLANPNFVERAPSRVVAQERERLEKSRATLQSLSTQLERLG